MKISSKVRYAVLALYDLATREGQYVSVAELAGRQSIPQTFLEQLLLRMKHAGLTASRRGPDGGYTLAVPASRIRVADVYVAIEGPVRLCCDENADPLDGLLWRELEDAILEQLNGITLEDLVERSNQPVPRRPIAHSYTFSI